MRLLLALALVVLTQPANAAPKLTLEQVIEKTLAGPRVTMANHEADAAAARISEADAARYPRATATLFGTISPKIECLDPECTMTSPQNFAFAFEGLFGSAQLDITQPLYTFGKITHARGAARAGHEAQRALADEAAGDQVVDAARAYWGVKLARELGYMLDDGIEEIEQAIERMEGRTGADAPTVQDRQRVAVLLAQARVQRADAAAAERQALAGLRALTQIRDADVDDEPLAAVERALPATVAGTSRPQLRAARAGAVAADELAEMAEAYYFPDLALVATAALARAQGVDDPPSAFANDPFNRTGAGAVLALQWTIEPWTVKARVARARAEARRAKAQRDLAAMGADYDAQTALAEATGARAKLDATEAGEKAGRSWVVSVLQSDAIGTAESRDLADAYLGWFGVRAAWAQSVFQWNVAVVRLGRALGEYRARR
jgi:outer membrane protein